MEQQEEKIRKTERNRSTQSSTMSSIPPDVTSKILSKLPLKSVLTSRCVSKHWSSISTDPYFISMFQKQNPSSLLFIFKENGKVFVFSVPQHSQNPNEPQHVDSYQMSYPKYCRLSFTESVHGLICLRRAANPIIWNPTMRKFSTLTKLNRTWKIITVYFGYDPIEGQHKVVCMPSGKASDECRVLTLGSAKKTWRTIKINNKHLPCLNNDARCINGVLYYRASLYRSNVDIIMSFDVRSEKFDMIEMPWGSTWWGKLIPYEGKLACVNKYMNNDAITLWVLEDAKWLCKHFAEPSYPHLNIICSIHGITDGGEFIYVPYVLKSSFYILYYDPKKKSYRKVEYEGIVDAEFRLSNGLGGCHLHPIHTCLNSQSLFTL